MAHAGHSEDGQYECSQRANYKNIQLKVKIKTFSVLVTVM